jgi:hypothetical protein
MGGLINQVKQGKLATEKWIHSIIGKLLLQSGKQHLVVFPKPAISYIILEAAKAFAKM